MTAAVTRVLIAAAGGVVAVRLTHGVPALFTVLAVGLVVFGLMNAAAVASGALFKRAPAVIPRAEAVAAGGG